MSPAPDSPPRNCQVTAVSSTALNTSWLVPADPNGLITCYTVWYTPVLSYSNISYTSTSSNMTTTSGNTTHQLLTDLLKGTSYSINITAYTFVGAGPSSTDQCITYTLEDGKSSSSNLFICYTVISLAIYLSLFLCVLFLQLQTVLLVISQHTLTHLRHSLLSGRCLKHLFRTES